MKFTLYKNYGALNSRPVFDAFEQGLLTLGLQSGNNGIPVIWSVLWHGRMAANKKIYDEAKRLNKPIIIIEVGSLIRGQTWKISIDHINALGEFSNKENLDLQRPTKLRVSLRPIKINRRNEILIATQHPMSLQWQGMPDLNQWVKQQVDELRQYTNRTIVVRPHPRSRVELSIPGVSIERPIRLPGTVDSFDFDPNYHCVVNHCSGPSVQSVIHGTPILCHNTSLAYPMSFNIKDIENPTVPDRTQWFLELCHTEWTVDEIAQGIPLKRLLPKIER